MSKFRRLFLLLVPIMLLSSCQLFAPQPVWIDVRTVEEYEQDNLAGSHNIPHTEIVSGIEALGLEKSTPVKLFCRSGRRAGLALTALEELGYTNVENVGGLNDAKMLFESAN